MKCLDIIGNSTNRSTRGKGEGWRWVVLHDACMCVSRGSRPLVADLWPLITWHWLFIGQWSSRGDTTACMVCVSCVWVEALCWPLTSDRVTFTVVSGQAGEILLCVRAWCVWVSEWVSARVVVSSLCWNTSDDSTCSVCGGLHTLGARAEG